MKNFFFLSLFFILAFFLRAEQQKDLMLAKIYHANINIENYLVSEKLDGVRARWNGKHLISRSGKFFAAPLWFTAGFGDVVMDGELWSKRSDFENISAIVRKKEAHKQWQELKFWVFDLPLEKNHFAVRVEKIKKIIQKTTSPYLKMVTQVSYSTNAELMKNFEKVIADGGEGLMLHRKGALYKKGRSNDLLKLKQYLDQEATVIGYKPGKGKYQGMLGSLEVRIDNGIVFFIGSGFSDKQRKTPPPIGSRITFRYQSLTKNNIPRFPVFLRIRSQE